MKARGWAVARETSSFGRQSSVACSNNSGRAAKLPGRSLRHERSQNLRRLAAPLDGLRASPSFGMAQSLGGKGPFGPLVEADSQRVGEPTEKLDSYD
jgi:hypothetical protein